jgi:thiol-disulfide isomerase/thioredoxin
MKFAILVACLACSGHAQQAFRVSLEVTPGAIQSSFTGIEIQADPAGKLSARLPGGGEVRLERMGTPATGLIARIAAADPEMLVLLNDQFSVVGLKRSIGHLNAVQYLLGYHRSERDGKAREALYWVPAYRAEGRLKLPGCELNLVLLDLNGDGIFDRKDSIRGTTIGLDMNNDGRIWGPAEWRKANEVIEVCGRPLEIAGIDPAGLAISFRDSDLKPAVTGTTVPSFTITSTGGTAIRSDSFRGRVHLLDFWASWCAPCVASLEHINALAREHTNDLSVIGINVDEPGRRSIAEKMVAEKMLSFPQVIRGLGERDFLWKIFGSMQDVRLSIPLYVVIDQKGVIRYASTGGEDLKEVRKLLKDLLP